nr:DUF3108 domain-containing protein [uncultured Desulfobacter sp.]
MNKTALWRLPALSFLVVIRLFFLVLLFLSLFCGSSAMAADKKASKNKLPFLHQEQLEYQIRWEEIDAGAAIFDVLAVTPVDKEPCRHFSLKVQSSPLVDVFYQIRDQYDSYADLAFDHSMRYIRKATGSEQRDILVQFNWKKGIARYSNFNTAKKPIPIPSGTFDPLAAFYKLRCMDLDSKKEIQFPITDGKKCFMGRAKIGGQETITCFNTTYDTYVIEPELTHFGGVFEESDNPLLRIWITADNRRLPVRIKAKVIVGSIIGELVSVR